MARRAYHRLRLADGSVVAGPVAVDTDRDGRPAAWHRLRGEEPATEWVGGTLDMSRPEGRDTQ